MILSFQALYTWALRLYRWRQWLKEHKTVGILMVCMGNICRSPTAQGVMEDLLRRERLADRVRVDSAGTHDYHVGRPPDARAQAVTRKRGIDISAQRARQAECDDFHEFDYVLAMDRDNLAMLRAICPKGQEGKLRLFLEFAPHLERVDVPDPYWGGPEGFERVMDMIEAAAEGLLADIRRRYL